MITGDRSAIGSSAGSARPGGAGVGSLRVESRDGDRNRPPLVLLAGIGAAAEMFDPLVAALPADLRIIRVDPPGIGLSGPADVPYSIAAMAGRLAHILDELGLDRVDVLGYSWGGAVAQQFALQHPWRCRRLVLASTSTGAFSFPGSPQVLADLAAPGWQSGDRRAWARRMLSRLDGGAVLSERSLAALTTATPTGYLFQLLAVGSWTSLPFLPLLTQPTLILSADDDRVIPAANAAVLGVLIPRARVHRFPGGHLNVISRAEQYAAVIAAFLADPN